MFHRATTDAAGRFEPAGLYGRSYAFEVDGYALAGPRTRSAGPHAGTIDAGDLVIDGSRVAR